MTKVILLEALKKFTEAATCNLLLPVRPTEEEPSPLPRPPSVYRMRLPQFRDATRKAPYIIHQAITGKDAQKEGIRLPEASAVVRTMFCTYNEDEEEGALSLLNMMERLRIALLEQAVVGKQFRLDLKAGLETLAYPDDTEPRSAPYYLGEMISTWRLPGIERKVFYGKEGHSNIKQPDAGGTPDPGANCGRSSGVCGEYGGSPAGSEQACL